MENCINSYLYEEIRKENYTKEIHTLDICIPIVKPYHNIAFPMSIIGCRPEYKGWVYSNFMNIYSLHQNNELMINYDVQYYEDQVYYLEMEKMTIATFDLFNNAPIEQIKKIIDREKYICLFIDEFYIEGTKYYGTKHYNHEIMIYGYNEYEKKLQCAYYGADSYYKLRKVKYKSFISSFNSIHLNRDSPFIMYSHHKDNKWLRPYYTIDSEYIKHTLRRYLNGTNFLYDRRHINPLYCSYRNKYGIQIYDDMKKYYDDMQEQKKYVDLRPFYFIYENKIIMMKRIQFLFEEHILENPNYAKKFQEVVAISRKILNLAIKHNVNTHRNRNTEEIKKNIIININKIKELEKKIISELIKMI